MYVDVNAKGDCCDRHTGQLYLGSSYTARPTDVWYDAWATGGNQYTEWLIDLLQNTALQGHCQPIGWPYNLWNLTFYKKIYLQEMQDDPSDAFENVSGVKFRVVSSFLSQLRKFE